MRVVSASIRRSPEACWRVLVDPELLPHWVPGLRRATVVARGADGLPAEIHFEFSASLTYSLVYRYDLVAREVRFEPRLGKRDGVRGFARIEATEQGGAELHYGLEVGDGRSPADRALDARALIAPPASRTQVLRGPRVSLQELHRHTGCCFGGPCPTSILDS